MYIANSLSDLAFIAKDIMEKFPNDRIFLLEGEMGAGKTTFTKAIGEYFNVEDNVSSPTFAIVNEYYSNIVGRIFHFDFYRIENRNEAFDIGLEEYLYSGNYCFLEWSEKVIELIPEEKVIIRIKVLDDNIREITANKQ
ncbi:MAG: tRNA (adenosine(37)-N6)-threonylcarbamoyltransferase complex ATPase subunit type 1 TsaE [Bacteroidales bacterium]|jgi:tRNA threonylcarbamoyladenosine biosynthesis protein TsaE|nr:tRNA (adenosine(37)-N6)-threonylcarbamoyltransferase complex ATPase subunit type 1 TsaE [Bacteroidales bacterium]